MKIELIFANKFIAQIVLTSKLDKFKVKEINK